MPVMPNMRRTEPLSALEAAAAPPPPTPITFVDTPSMDYVAWLNAAGPRIAGIPGSPRVAVIGSGGAGLSAAYELLRCGVNVTVFEATPRIGGRLFTSPSATRDGNVFEMGAMRFSPSERVLHHYAKVFNDSGASTITFDTGPFPDPGVYLTYIAFQSQTYVWDPNSTTNKLPPQYPTVSKGWNAFVTDGFKSADGTISLVAPDDLTEWLGTDPEGNKDKIVAAWQGYIDAFVNATLYEAIVRIFTDPNAPGGQLWAQDDFEFFGALGTGFGGFSPLFPICFLDIIRFVINAVDTDQHGITTGVVSIVKGFLDQKVTLPNGSTDTLRRRVVLSRPVVGITSSGPRGPVQLRFVNGDVQAFDRVIVATSHRSMELTMGLGYSKNGLPLVETVADAVRRLHLENSSKVFAEASAYWLQNPWPRNVVGDTILRNLYTLVYPAAAAKTTSLLFSYTWADDSVKQQTYIDPNQRLNLLLPDLATVSPQLATVVAQSIKAGTVQVIDWQREPYFFGAFKLNQPGQDVYAQALFYDFRKAGTGSDTGVYLAGDSIGFLGGWVENAFQTGINAAAGVAVSLGGTLNAEALGPFQQLDPTLYRYDTTDPPAREREPALVANPFAE